MMMFYTSPHVCCLLAVSIDLDRAAAPALLTPGLNGAVFNILLPPFSAPAREASEYSRRPALLGEILLPHNLGLKQN